MSERLPSLPDICQAALQAIEADPLELTREARLHLQGCPACREARVHWLAQEDAPQALAPSGYFQNLPQRVLRKLPVRASSPRRQHPILWLAAGLLIATATAGGFMAGRVNRTPMMEASLPAPQASEGREVVPVTPFRSEDDVLSQLSTLSPEETEALAKRLDAEAKKPEPR